MAKVVSGGNQQQPPSPGEAAKRTEPEWWITVGGRQWALTETQEVQTGAKEKSFSP